MNNRRKIKKSVIVIIVLAVVLIISGISYALWQITHKGEETNKIASGCFEMQFKELTGSVNLTNSYPMSDAKGLASTPYTFTIKNKCEIYGEYVITLDVVNATTTIDESKIKVAMDGAKKLSPTILGTLETNTTEETEIKTSYILVKDKAKVGGEEKTYSFRMWVDESAGNEVMGQGIEARLTITSIAAVQEIGYSTSFGSSVYDQFNSVTSISDGGYIAVGTTSATTKEGDLLTNHKETLKGGQDALIVKYDVSGNLEWSNSFGSTSYEDFRSIISTSDDGFIAVGVTVGTITDGDFSLASYKGTLRGGGDCLIAKYDANGDLVWSNSFGSALGEYFQSVTQTPDEGYIAVGYTQATSKTGDFLTNHKGTLRGGGFDALIVKYDANGNLVWSNSFGSTAAELIQSVTQTPDEGYIAVGHTTATSKTGDFLINHKGTLRGGDDGIIIKYDKNGNLLWSNSFGSTAADQFNSVTSTTGGEFIAVGETQTTSKTGDFLTNHKGTLRGGQDGLIVKYDANGNVVWSNSFGSSANDYFSSITTTPDGGYITVGDTLATVKDGDLSLVSFKGTLRGSKDAIIIKYDASGDLVWSNSFGSTVDDYFQSAISTTDGEFIAVGYTNATSKSGDFLTNHKGTLRGSGDALIVKFNEEGNFK